MNTSCLRGIKGCFLCGQGYRANENHKREELSAEIERLKKKHASAFLTVADLDAVYEMGDVSHHELEDHEYQTECAEEDTDDDEFIEEMVYVTKQC